MSLIEITGKEEFDTQISQSDKLVLVDFRADWCGPCKMLGPVLHDLAEKHSDKIDVLKVNVDDTANQPLAVEYNVRSIPQVTLFKDGAQVDQFVGAVPPDQIEAYITKYAGE